MRAVAAFRAEGARRVASGPVLQAAGVAVLAVAGDAVSKAWALSALRGGHRITTPGGLVRLQLVINHGAAFGLAARYELVLSAVAAAGVVLLGTWAVRASGCAERLGAALAAGGAAGNLVDRLIRPPSVLHGGVTDWLHVWFYGPTFNLADLWLRGGLLVAAAGWLWHRRPPARLPPASGGAVPGLEPGGDEFTSRNVPGSHDWGAAVADPTWSNRSRVRRG